MAVGEPILEVIVMELLSGLPKDLPLHPRQALEVDEPIAPLRDDPDEERNPSVP